MQTYGNNNKLLSEINVTPFVDVMLVLLIIFMVTTPMMTHGVNVVLPKTNSKALTTNNPPLILSINKENQIFVDDYVVPFYYLQDKIKRLLKNQPNRKVFLKADKDISYGTVIKVMSEIQNAGIKNIGMITEPLSKINKKTK